MVDAPSLTLPTISSSTTGTRTSTSWKASASRRSGGSRFATRGCGSASSATARTVRSGRSARVPSIFLPVKHAPTQRETLLYIPGASHMDQGQLREILAAETEKIQSEAKSRGMKQKARYSKEQVAGALKDYRQYLNRKQAAR